MIADCAAVITRDAGLSAELIDAAPALKAIVSHGTGVDSIDVEVAIAHGIVVANTPGLNAQSVAELALGLMISAARRIVPADHAVRAGNHTFRNSNSYIELAGKTALILGWGHVGRKFGKMLMDAFDMDVLVYSPHADEASIAETGARPQHDLHGALRRANVVSLHLPLRPDTEHIIGSPEFSALLPGAILVNTARAGLIDERALITALDEGKVFSAGLDLHQDTERFRGRDDVVLTPHLGGTTEESSRRTGLAAAEAVIDILNGRVPVHQVGA